MIAKTLIFVCAAFGLVAGCSFEVCAPQQQLLALPAPAAPASMLHCETQCAPQSAPRFEFSCAAAPQPAPRFEFSCAPAPQHEAPACFEFAHKAEAAPRLELLSAPACECSNTLNCAPVHLGLPSCGLPSSCNGPAAAFEFASGSSASASSYHGPAGSGPETAPLPMLQAPSVTLPAVEAPLITLSSPAIPAPRVISSKCICTKTIVKPQVYERTITVPKIQRYLKRTVTPVVENVAYRSKPMGSPASSGPSLSAALSGTGAAYLCGPAATTGCGAPVLACAPAAPAPACLCQC